MSSNQFRQDLGRADQVAKQFLDPYYNLISRQCFIRYSGSSENSTDTFYQRVGDVDAAYYDRSARCWKQVEEKIRFGSQWSSDILLEYWSCSTPGHKAKGWMHYGKADLLMYCYLSNDQAKLECVLLDFHALRAWFFAEVKGHGGIDHVPWKKITTEQRNHTVSYVVPYREISTGIMVDRFFLPDYITRARRVEAKQWKKAHSKAEVVTKCATWYK